MPMWPRLAQALWGPQEPAELPRGRQPQPTWGQPGQALEPVSQSFSTPYPHQAGGAIVATVQEAQGAFPPSGVLSAPGRQVSGPDHFDAQRRDMSPVVRSLRQPGVEVNPQRRDARMVELEAALVMEQRRADAKEQELHQKDAELQSMNQLVTKLQAALEASQKEQDKISQLEQAMITRVDSGENAKVEKLLLAIAGEKQIAEERAEELDVARRQLGERTEELGAVRRQLDEELRRRGGTEKWVSEKEKQLSDARLRLGEEDHIRQGLEAKNRELERQVRTLQQAVAEELKKREDACSQYENFRRQARQDGGGVSAREHEMEREICELQQQLREELSKRREVQYQNLANIEKLLEVQNRLAQERQGQSAMMFQSSRPSSIPPFAADGRRSVGTREAGIDDTDALSQTHSGSQSVAAYGAPVVMARTPSVVRSHTPPPQQMVPPGAGAPPVPQQSPQSPVPSMIPFGNNAPHTPLTARPGQDMRHRAAFHTQWVANVHGPGGQVVYTRVDQPQGGPQPMYDQALQNRLAQASKTFT